MPDPYRVLNVGPGDSDETIRRVYLEAVRSNPPERRPQQFERIRSAYERIKDERSRLELLLLTVNQGETLDDLVGEEQCRKSCTRMSLRALMGLMNRAGGSNPRPAVK